MIMDELEKILATTERVKMIYVIPDFQNPTGRTWDLDRRHRFMEIINRYEIPVVEDNPYGELRFEGEYMPALKSLDTKGLVIYLGTFSKILAPGYRLGWVCAEDAHPREVQLHGAGRLAAGVHHRPDGDLQVDRHVRSGRPRHHHPRVLPQAPHRDAGHAGAWSCRRSCTFTHPDGGLFAWVVLPEYMDAKDLQMKCLAKQGRLCSRRLLLPQRRPREHPAPELQLHARGQDRQGHHGSVPDHPREPAVILLSRYKETI